MGFGQGRERHRVHERLQGLEGFAGQKLTPGLTHTALSSRQGIVKFLLLQWAFAGVEGAYSNYGNQPFLNKLHFICNYYYALSLLSETEQ